MGTGVVRWSSASIIVLRILETGLRKATLPAMEQDGLKARLEVRPTVVVLRVSPVSSREWEEECKELRKSGGVSEGVFKLIVRTLKFMRKPVPEKVDASEAVLNKLGVTLAFDWLKEDLS